MTKLRAVVVFVGAMSAATPAGAQEAPFEEELRPVRVLPGAHIVYARPVGEFHSYVKHGGGMNLNLVLPVSAGNPLALRADGGFIVYGSERQRVCFSGTVGCRVQLDLTTTNSIVYVNAGPQLMLPEGAVRPYVNGAIGFSYFGTSSQVEGTGGGSNPFAHTTNFSDITFSWVGGGGLLVQLASGRTPVHLDLGARYVGNGQVEYLKKGDIEDHPDGSITLHPTRSQANLVNIHLGVTFGARPGRH